MIARIAMVLGVAIPLAAGAQGSPVLPLDDVSYVYLDALMARGQLRGLSALERPYTVAAVRAALDSVRASAPSPAVLSFAASAARAAA